MNQKEEHKAEVFVIFFSRSATYKADKQPVEAMVPLSKGGGCSQNPWRHLDTQWWHLEPFQRSGTHLWVPIKWDFFHSLQFSLSLLPTPMPRRQRHLRRKLSPHTPVCRLLPVSGSLRVKAESLSEIIIQCYFYYPQLDLLIAIQSLACDEKWMKDFSYLTYET